MKKPLLTRYLEIILSQYKAINRAINRAINSLEL